MLIRSWLASLLVCVVVVRSIPNHHDLGMEAVLNETTADNCGGSFDAYQLCVNQTAKVREAACDSLLTHNASFADRAWCYCYNAKQKEICFQACPTSPELLHSIRSRVDLCRVVPPVYFTTNGSSPSDYTAIPQTLHERALPALYGLPITLTQTPALTAQVAVATLQIDYGAGPQTLLPSGPVATSTLVQASSVAISVQAQTTASTTMTANANYGAGPQTLQPSGLVATPIPVQASSLTASVQAQTTASTTNAGYSASLQALQPSGIATTPTAVQASSRASLGTTSGSAQTAAITTTTTSAATTTTAISKLSLNGSTSASQAPFTPTPGNHIPDPAQRPATITVTYCPTATAGLSPTSRGSNSSHQEHHHHHYHHYHHHHYYGSGNASTSGGSVNGQAVGQGAPSDYCSPAAAGQSALPPSTMQTPTPVPTAFMTQTGTYQASPGSQTPYTGPFWPAPLPTHAGTQSPNSDYHADSASTSNSPSAANLAAAPNDAGGGGARLPRAMAAGAILGAGLLLE